MSAVTLNLSIDSILIKLQFVGLLTLKKWKKKFTKWILKKDLEKP